MSLTRIRCGVRIAAGTIGVLFAVYGVALAVDGEADQGAVMRILTRLILVAGVWVIVEVVVGGFARLEESQADAYAIAAQTVCETLRSLNRQAEDPDKVRVLHGR